MNQIPDIQPLSPQVGGATNGHQSSTATAATAPAKAGTALPKHRQSNSAKIGNGTVDNAVVQVNKYLQSQNRGLEFSVDKATGQAIVKVVDRASGQVIRQIPPEYIVRLAQTLLEHNGISSTGVQVKT